MNKSSAYAEVQRDSIIEQHAGLVRRIAHHLKGRLPASVQLDDLVQAGMIGLLEASRNFDGSKGASFETYAGIRIRGAMLDEMRRGDWVPRSVHRNSRRIADAIQVVENEYGRDASDAEIASQLDMTLEQYHHILNEVSTGKIIGFEDLGVSDDVITSEELVNRNLPFEGLETGHFRKALTDAISSLPEREALVLSLYYDEELNLREIGEVLNVSESRVSQIHSQSMHRLKSKLRSWQN